MSECRFYRWRQLTREERERVLSLRKKRKNPWHSPPHPVIEVPHRFHLSAACYEHRAYIGQSATWMSGFSETLLSVLDEEKATIFAWCVLPNHYHVLIESGDINKLLGALGRFHGRTSWTWNGEEGCRGRKIFHRTADRAMRSDRHFWSTLNYVHHNPVRHGHVKKWRQWMWSSAVQYLETVGRDEAIRIWKAYPVRDYGKGWDDP